MKRIVNLGDTIDRSQFGGQTFIIDVGKDPHQSVGFSDFDNLANAVARGLARKGFAAGSRIGILGANSLEYLAAFFGILRTGLIAVPIHHKLPANQVRAVLEHSGCSWLFVESRYRDLLLSRLDSVEFGRQFENFLDFGFFQAVVPGGEQPAFILYTSGSSGDPKGVVISHRSHIWVLEKSIGSTFMNSRRQGDSWTTLISAPLSHMNGLSKAETVCATGGTLVLMPQFEEAAFVTALESYKVNCLSVVPPMLAMILRKEHLLDRADLSSVRMINFASAPLSETLLGQTEKYFPQAAINNRYGLTEVGPRLFGPHPKRLPTPRLSVGYPRPGIDFRLVEGVLQVRSPSMMSEYYKDPELQRRRITADGFFITNDLFRTDANGFYFFLGRSDDMFVCGGENIFASEVEKILESHPALETAVVIPLPDAIKGAKPFAFVTLKNGANCSEAEIKSHTLENAPAYKHPRRIWRMPILPLNTVGKIDRPALVALAQKYIDGREAEEAW